MRGEAPDDRERAAAPRRLTRWLHPSGSGWSRDSCSAPFRSSRLLARLAPQHCCWTRLRGRSRAGHRRGAGRRLRRRGRHPVLALDPAAAPSAWPPIRGSRARVTPCFARGSWWPSWSGGGGDRGARSPPTAWLVDAGGTPFAFATGVDREMHPTIVGVEDAQPRTRIPSSPRVCTSPARSAGASCPQPGEFGWGATTRARSRRCGSVPRRSGARRRGSGREARAARLGARGDLAEMGPASTIDLRFGDRVVLRSGPPPGRRGGGSTRRRGCRPSGGAPDEPAVPTGG